MGKIHRIDNKDIIPTIEKLLKEAQAGKLEYFIAATRSKEGSTGVIWCNVDGPEEFLELISFLQAQCFQNMML